MNAHDLFRIVDGAAVPAGVWYCEGCRKVSNDQRLAEECCKPRFCACGAPTSGYWTICGGCIHKKELEKEAAKFEAAAKSAEYDGPFYCDGLGEEFFRDIESLEDTLEFEAVRPLYVWCCNKLPVVKLDVNDILDGLCDDAYEDFDPDDLDGIDDLRAALVRFNAANEGVTKWEPDYSRARLLGPTPEA